MGRTLMALPRNYLSVSVSIGVPLIDVARRVTRLSGGSFVVFSTSSVYNCVPDTYDGLHHTISSDEFRAYIHRNADRDR